VPDVNDALVWECRSFAELSPAQLYRILKLRQDVFILEQDCLYPDIDDQDLHAQHIFAHEGDSLLAYLRSLPPGLDYRESSLGRIVVSQAARGRRLGRELVRRGIHYNRERWPDASIRIGAQAYLEAFYVDMGFVTDSAVYVEDGIPHIKMVFEGDA
jgi:ElaA protein